MNVPPIPLWAALAFYGALIISRFTIWLYAKEKVETPVEEES